MVAKKTVIIMQAVISLIAQTFQEAIKNAENMFSKFPQIRRDIKGHIASHVRF